MPKIYWRQLAPLLVCLCLMPLVWWRLINEWQGAEQDLAHGLPAFFAYLFVLTFRPIKHEPLLSYEKPLTFLALLIPLGTYLIAETVNIHALGYLSLMAALALSFALFYGWRSALKFWHLHLFFIIALPFWDALLEPLVRLASFVSAAVLTPLDFAMLIEGNSITVPSGRIIIAEGCSGIRYFMVAILLGYLLANLNGYKGARLILTVSCAALLGLMANWLRICLLILIGYYSDMQSSLMSDHELFGWVIFASFCLPAFYFAPHKKVQTVPQLTASVPVTPLIISLVVGLSLNLFIHQLRTPSENLELSPYFSYNTDRWRPIRLEKPIAVHSPGLAYTSWMNASNGTKLHYTLHSRKHPDDKLVPFFTRSRVSDAWFVEKILSTPLPKSHPLVQRFNGNTLTVNMELFKSLNTDKRILSVEIFRVGGRITNSYNEAKIQQVPALLSKANIFEYFLLQKPCQEESCQQSKAAIINALGQLGNNQP